MTKVRIENTRDAKIGTRVQSSENGALIDLMPGPNVLDEYDARNIQADRDGRRMFAEGWLKFAGVVEPEEPGEEKTPAGFIPRWLPPPQRDPNQPAFNVQPDGRETKPLVDPMKAGERNDPPGTVANPPREPETALAGLDAKPVEGTPPAGPQTPATPVSETQAAPSSVLDKVRAAATTTKRNS